MTERDYTVVAADADIFENRITAVAESSDGAHVTFTVPLCDYLIRVGDTLSVTDVFSKAGGPVHDLRVTPVLMCPKCAHPVNKCQCQPCGAGGVGCIGCFGCNATGVYNAMDRKFTVYDETIKHPLHILREILKETQPPLATTQTVYGTFSDSDPHPDVCRYSKPVPIEIDGVGVSCFVRLSERPQVGGDGSSAAAQVRDGIKRVRAQLQSDARARIARLMRWPYCGHTQRNVSVVWIDDAAYWQCEECREKVKA